MSSRATSQEAPPLALHLGVEVSLVRPDQILFSERNCGAVLRAKAKGKLVKGYYCASYISPQARVNEQSQMLDVSGSNEGGMPFVIQVSCLRCEDHVAVKRGIMC